MGLRDTGTVNDAATAGAGRGTPITRDPWDTGPRNPNSFFGPGQGSNYVPAKIGAYATPEPPRRNKTDLKITLTPDPVSGGGSRCPFGELTSIPDTDPPETGILGGIIHCGDKNFAVPNKEINLASDGVTLIYLEIDVTANIDDAGEILLPGIETSSETDPATFWESDAWAAGPPATQYPDNTRPVVSTGIGKIIVPIGKLTIADGAATLEPVGCGNITISHCGGTLTAARG